MTWNYIGGGGNDLALFEDIRNCAARSFDLDLSRVWSTGFSFGALWTTFLTLKASDVLAGTVTFSGGTGDSIGLSYTTPFEPIPVLAAWGGAADGFDSSFFQIDFADITAEFTDNLEADGHTVVRCDHGLGHTMPPEWSRILENFLLAESFGAPSPHAAHDLGDLPDYCF